MLTNFSRIFTKTKNWSYSVLCWCISTVLWWNIQRHSGSFVKKILELKLLNLTTILAFLKLLVFNVCTCAYKHGYYFKFQEQETSRTTRPTKTAATANFWTPCWCWRYKWQVGLSLIINIDLLSEIIFSVCHTEIASVRSLKNCLVCQIWRDLHAFRQTTVV